MPAKFKPSHKESIKGKDGRPTKRWFMRHYYLKQTPTDEIIEAINKGKRKHRNKFINELTRRGVKLVWKTEEELAQDT
tara:strand:- start:1123 stop:1356 length:234 start_codon:yes stop_codon:yes gene_type:complete